jgi:regulator of nucleoside diphosphate kinase
LKSFNKVKYTEAFMRQEQPHLIITEQDFQRLSAIALSQRSEAVNLLDEELGRAEIVDPEDLPPDVVTMNSVVTYRDENTGEEKQIGLVYPNHADAAEGRISILAPIGLALIGLRVGQSIEWQMPSGQVKKLTVTEVSFQPEASGKYDF